MKKEAIIVKKNVKKEPQKTYDSKVNYFGAGRLLDYLDAQEDIWKQTLTLS